MGAFSELNMEQSFPEPSASPFISSMFGEGPTQAATPAENSIPAPELMKTDTQAAMTPLAEVSSSVKAEQHAPTAIKEKLKAPQSGQNFVESSESSKEQDKKSAEKTDEDAKRKAHEEAEAKRKAEWEAKFAERRAREKAERDRVAALSDDAVMQEAMKRVADGFERLTRRNMKDCVSEYIQTMCISDPVFGRRVMDPKKDMTHCIWYINRKAQEFVEKELKDNGMKPERGIYGCDVPDDLIYQWAVEYFNDPNAKEDEPEDEKFVPKPYYGGASTSKSKKDKEKEKAKKEAEKKAAAKKAAEEKARKKADDGQMSLLGAA